MTNEKYLYDVVRNFVRKKKGLRGEGWKMKGFIKIKTTISCKFKAPVKIMIFPNNVNEKGTAQPRRSLRIENPLFILISSQRITLISQ